MAAQNQKNENFKQQDRPSIVTRRIEPVRTSYEGTHASLASSEQVEHSSINWRAIFAGAFISLLAYMIFMTLGLGVGGSSIQTMIRGGSGSAQSFGIGAGIWLIVSILASLFIGAYLSGRVAGLISSRVGRSQGLVVAALFFAFLFSQLGSAIGTVGRGLGATAGALGGAAGDLSQNPQVQGMVEDAIGDLNLKSPPETVVKGVATRLVRGDQDSAVKYFSRQAGISEAEARQRISTLNQQVQQAGKDAGTSAARAATAAGWTLFGALALGSLFAMLGGGVGAQANLRKPLSRSDQSAIRDQDAA